MSNKRNPDDIIEMKRLRFEEHLSIREIGERFNITKERVRQLIGNTGYYIKGHKDVSNERKIILNPVIEILRKQGFVVAKDLSTRNQVLIINNHKVKVLLANKKTSPKKGVVNTQYTFSPINMENTDISILFISETQDIFIVPTSLLINRMQIRFVWPYTDKPRQSGFQKFHNRFDLLT